jgi:hypothetical protein
MLHKHKKGVVLFSRKRPQILKSEKWQKQLLDQE